jgi:hypothetical protein
MTTPGRDLGGFQRRQVPVPPPPSQPPEPDPVSATGTPDGRQVEAGQSTPSDQSPPAPDRPTGRGTSGARRARSHGQRTRSRGTTHSTASSAGKEQEEDGEPQERREQVTVLVPGALCEQVRQEAQRRRITQTALFIDGLNATHERLRAELAHQGGEGGRAAKGARPSLLLHRDPPRRRYRVEIPTQLGLQLTDTEKGVVDGFWQELGLASRSDLVTRVFELYLPTDRSGTSGRAGRG